jgi:hypothetical protein
MILNSPYITGSLTVTGNATIAGNITITGSLSGTATSASYAYTASSAINATSASKAISSSYADTASFSNDFTVLGNLTVYGTQSIQYITSSQLNVSDNVITVNVASPGVRFGGLSVFDSGSLSSEATASLFWDSQNNHWIYQRESGSSYDGGMLISGPRNAAGLGNEQGTTSCMLLVGQGGDHLTSSLIYHSSTATCIPNALISTSSSLFLSGTNKRISTYAPSSWVGISDYVCNGVGFQFTRPNDDVFAHAIFSFNGTTTNNLAISSRSDLVIATGGGLGEADERIRITSAGNLYVGAACGARGSTATKGLIKMGTSQEYFELQATSTSTTTGLLFSDGSTGNYGLVQYDSTDNMNFYTAGSERLRITSDGKLKLTSTSGGGTNLDMYLLENDGLYINSNEGATARGIYFQTGGTERMRISSAGVSYFACQVCVPFIRYNGRVTEKVGNRNGTGTYSLFYNGSGVTQSSGTVFVEAIYGTPNSTGQWMYMIGGNRSISTSWSNTTGFSGTQPTVCWVGCMLQVNNTNPSVYYSVTVRLNDIGNGWDETWGNFPGF